MINKFNKMEIHIINSLKEDDYKKDIQSEMNKVFDFLNIKRIEIDAEQKYMVGGWQWENNRMKRFMMKNNPIKSFLKFMIPFKSLRKRIRQNVQYRNTSLVPELSKENKKKIKVKL